MKRRARATGVLHKVSPLMIGRSFRVAISHFSTNLNVGCEFKEPSIRVLVFHGSGLGCQCHYHYHYYSTRMELTSQSRIRRVVSWT